ncbi:MAG: YCF48-related protein [Planctomycetota bacterium]
MDFPSICKSIFNWITCHTMLQGAFGMTALTLVTISTESRADQDLPRESLPNVWKQNAELSDVCFLNQKNGWVVGASGVILKTTDGGNTWEDHSAVSAIQQNELTLDQKFRNLRNGIQSPTTGFATEKNSNHSPIRCRLESVHFVDKNHGWALGGYRVPWVNRTKAVVMRTKDGGETWQTVKDVVTPRLKKVEFHDPAHGWAIGDTGNLFKSGIFTTNNGGLTWKGQASKKWRNWKDAVQLSGGVVVVIDEEGRPGRIQNDRFEPAVAERALPGNFNQLIRLSNSNLMAVGDNGLVAESMNQGKSWTRVRLPDADAYLGQLDLRTVAVQEEYVWLGGNPGTILVRVHLPTRNTKVIRTPTHACINKIQFVDESHGWAVGSFGTILATHDGGESWVLQRGSSPRVALMAFGTDTRNAPLELLSKVSAEDGFLTAAVMLQGSQNELKALEQSVDRLGGLVTLSCSPNSRMGKTLGEYKQLEKVVREIRTLRPSVVSLDQPTHTGSEHQWQMLRKAIPMAEDSLAFPDQIKLLGLKPWQVKKTAFQDPAGSLKLDPQILLPVTGTLLQDQVAMGKGILGHADLAIPVKTYRIEDRRGLTSQRNDLWSGLQSGLQGPPKRKHKGGRGNLAMVKKASIRNRKFDEFLQFEARTPGDFLVWKRNVEEFMLPLEPQMAGLWMSDLMQRYVDAGKMELAASCADLIVTRWPDHAFAPAFSVWLTRYFSSIEFSHLAFLNLPQQIQNSRSSNSSDLATRFQTAPRTINNNGVSTVVWLPVEAEVNANLDQPNQDPSAKFFNFHEARLRRAGRYLSRLGARDPDLLAGPINRFTAAKLTHELVGKKEAESKHRSLAKAVVEHPEMKLAVSRELDLHDANQDLARSKFPVCKYATIKPILDGTLQEACWDCDQNEIEDGDRICFAYDSEYLYIAIQCQKLEGGYYQFNRLPRPRDPDLRGRDRVEILLDLDRDYHACFRFEVDHRGWVSDGLTGHVDWNPDWYVCQGESEQFWTAEIAIPIEKISLGGLNSNMVWAFRAVRKNFSEQILWENSPLAVKVIQKDQGIFRSGLGTAIRHQAELFELIRFEPEANRAVNSQIRTASQSSQSD